MTESIFGLKFEDKEIYGTKIFKKIKRSFYL